MNVRYAMFDLCDLIMIDTVYVYQELDGFIVHHYQHVGHIAYFCQNGLFDIGWMI